MSATAQIRIFSVDDHPLLHEGLAAVIRHQSDMVMVAEASTGQEAIQRFQEYIPDVTLMDLRLPDMSGIDAMIAIRSRFPEARVIILTTFANTTEVQRAFEAGARAYLLKTMPPKQLVEAIRQVHAGKKQIPPDIASHLPVHYIDNALTTQQTVKPPRTTEAREAGGDPAADTSEATHPLWLSRLLRRK
jgi:DNA-binding NarL/FixJ family response regulator